MERARVRVAQFEAAVQLLDVEDPALPPLREALMKARAQASAPPLTDQIASPELYVARKKKRLEEAEQGILEAVRKRDLLKTEVVAGEERLARLKDDLEMSRSSTVPGVSTPSTNLQAEVQKLCCRGRVDTGAGPLQSRNRRACKKEVAHGHPSRTQHSHPEGIARVGGGQTEGFDERLVIWSGGLRRCHTNEVN